MAIKEFSHKHSLVFFWATIILALLFVVSAAGRMHGDRGGRMMMKGGDRYDKKMMNRPYGPNMNSGTPQGQVEATMPVGGIPVDDVPVSAQ